MYFPGFLDQYFTTPQHHNDNVAFVTGRLRDGSDERISPTSQIEVRNPLAPPREALECSESPAISPEPMILPRHLNKALENNPGVLLPVKKYCSSSRHVLNRDHIDSVIKLNRLTGFDPLHTALSNTPDASILVALDGSKGPISIDRELHVGFGQRVILAGQNGAEGNLRNSGSGSGSGFGFGSSSGSGFWFWFWFWFWLWLWRCSRFQPE